MTRNFEAYQIDRHMYAIELDPRPNYAAMAVNYAAIAISAPPSPWLSDEHDALTRLYARLAFRFALLALTSASGPVA